MGEKFDALSGVEKAAVMADAKERMQHVKPSGTEVGSEGYDELLASIAEGIAEAPYEVLEAVEAHSKTHAGKELARREQEATAEVIR